MTAIAIAIAGVTATGNMGGVAMLKTTVQEMSRRLPGANFVLLSLTPQADRVRIRENGMSAVTVVSATPLLLVGVYLPLSILLWPLWRRGWLRGVAKRIPYFRALAECEVLIDLSGIAFVDARGFALLMYNLAVFMPALAFGTKVAKLSQALGPFDRRLNRALARRALDRCEVVVARGRSSLAALEKLGIANATMLPDVTFCLEVSVDDSRRARQRLLDAGVAGEAVIISPSAVVSRYLQGVGRDFCADLIEVIAAIRGHGLEVVLLPHSFGGEGSKNNDVPLCRQVYASLADRTGVWLLDDVQDPVALRALIGQARFFIGSRFHSVVAALSMGVPALTIGWSHKYREMAAMLCVENLVVDYSDFDPARVIDTFSELVASEQSIRQRIRERLEVVCADAGRNFDLVTALVAPGRC